MLCHRCIAMCALEGAEAGGSWIWAPPRRVISFMRSCGNHSLRPSKSRIEGLRNKISWLQQAKVRRGYA